MAAPISTYESATVQCAAPGCERGMRTKGLCSKHYQRHRAGVPFTVDCGYCGKTTERKQYCSIGCSQLARARRLGVKARVYVEPRQCVVCFQLFKRKSPSTRDAAVCCSRECGFALIRQRGEQSRKIAEAKTQFERWANMPMLQARHKEQRAARELREARKGLFSAIISFVVNPLRPCVGCGAALGRKDKRASRCQSCALVARRASNRASPCRRADKAKRKAMQRGRLEGAERFDPTEILERDGWRCHMCGCSTPKRLRGTYNDRAPELDHIFPLALGGQHTRINTACACRKCNREKGASPRGQLRLAA